MSQLISYYLRIDPGAPGKTSVRPSHDLETGPFETLRTQAWFDVSAPAIVLRERVTNRSEANTQASGSMLGQIDRHSRNSAMILGCRATFSCAGGAGRGHLPGTHDDSRGRPRSHPKEGGRLRGKEGLRGCPQRANPLNAALLVKAPLKSNLECFLAGAGFVHSGGVAIPFWLLSGVRFPRTYFPPNVKPNPVVYIQSLVLRPGAGLLS